MKILILLISLSLSLISCIHVDEEASTNFNKSVELFGKAIANEFNKTNDLFFLTSWYFKKNGKWPNNKADLEKLVVDNQAPIDLSAYSHISFQDNDEEITIEYIRKLNDSSLPIKLTASKEELMNIEYLSPQNNDKGMIKLPKNSST